MGVAVGLFARTPCAPNNTAGQASSGTPNLRFDKALVRDFAVRLGALNFQNRFLAEIQTVKR